MGWKIVDPPIAEPLTIEECRAHLRVTPFATDSDGNETHPDDSLIMAMQTAAREFCEDFTGLSLAVKTYEYRIDAFPEHKEIRLPWAPLVEVLSLVYVGPDETLITMAPSAYLADEYQQPGWLLPVSTSDWPKTADVVNAVRVQYRAGYAVPGDQSDAEVLPGVIRAAMLLVLGHLYEHRTENTEKALAALPLGVEALLRPHRVRLGMA
jgi:uncharacterized phiE125 gp8 family phage protein